MQTYRLIPALCAPSTFSLIPPTGVIAPRKVISPVMAVVGGTSLPVKSETKATTIAKPADGPSFLTAPEGKWS